MIGFFVYLLIWFMKLFFPSYWKVDSTMIYAQSFHETDGFKSKAFREGNNLFGMNPSTRHLQSGRFKKGEGAEEVAKFSNWFISVYDYFKRQKQFYVSGSNYMKDTEVSPRNQKRYATDKRYLEKWSVIYKQKKNHGLAYKISSISVFGLVIWGIVFLIKKL